MVEIISGGETTYLVGSLLEKLAIHNQIIVVTHFAQIAVKNTCHIKVVKYDDGEKTWIQLLELDDEEKISEITRLVGGNSKEDIDNMYARKLFKQQNKVRIKLENRNKKIC